MLSSPEPIASVVRYVKIIRCRPKPLASCSSAFTIPYVKYHELIAPASSQYWPVTNASSFESP